MPNIQKPIPGVPNGAFVAMAQVWQEDGRWTIHIADLPEWVVSEINRLNYRYFDNQMAEQEKEFIKLALQKGDC